MMSFYFAGFTAGALVLPRIIVSVGHVRTFAGFAAIASMTTLLHVTFVEPIAWMPLRLATGFAYAGMILATESWLNAHAVQSTRGQLLSIFGVVSMGSWAVGQALNIAAPASVTLFIVVSLLISAAVVPITLLPSHPPAEVEQESVALKDVVLVSPLAAVGVFLAGLAIGGFWGMGPNFAQRIGLDVSGISAFMAAVLGGTLALQWPLGWLSDRVSRNLPLRCCPGVCSSCHRRSVGGGALCHCSSRRVRSSAALESRSTRCVSPPRTTTFRPVGDSAPREGFFCSTGSGQPLDPYRGSAMNIVGPGGLFLAHLCCSLS
jgi:MFS family permease